MILECGARSFFSRATLFSRVAVFDVLDEPRLLINLFTDAVQLIQEIFSHKAGVCKAKSLPLIDDIFEAFSHQPVDTVVDNHAVLERPPKEVLELLHGRAIFNCRPKVGIAIEIGHDIESLRQIIKVTIQYINASFSLNALLLIRQSVPDSGWA